MHNTIPSSVEKPPSDSSEAQKSQLYSKRTAWGLTFVLMALYTINYSDKLLLGLVAQPLKDDLGLTSSQIGFVSSAFFLAFTVGGFFAGAINKWMTLKWSLIAVALIWAATMIPMVVVGSFAVLVVTRIILGFAEGPSGALILSATYSWHPVEKRGVPSSVISAANSTAKIAIAPVLTILIIKFGWHAGFLVLALVGVLWCVVWYFVWKPGPYAEIKKINSEKKSTKPSVPWAKILLSRTFLGALAAAFPMYGLITVVLTWLPSYFEEGLGFTRLQAGSMFGFPSIAALAAMFISTWITDKLMTRGVSAKIVRGIVPGVGLALCGLSMVVLPLIHIPMAVVITISVGYGIGCIVTPITNAAVSQICPPDQVAGALGVLLAMQAVTGIIAPPITGAIVDNAATAAAGYAQSFQIFGVVSIVGAVLAMILMNPGRDAERILALAQSK
ncbi:MFS transporter [Corynebacterium glutamicum MT]|nr:MFS transporter [Corynebacterium glutamicum MT]